MKTIQYVFIIINIISFVIAISILSIALSKQANTTIEYKKAVIDTTLSDCKYSCDKLDYNFLERELYISKYGFIYDCWCKDKEGIPIQIK